MVTTQGNFVAVFNIGMAPLYNVQITISATRMGAVGSVRDRVSGQNLSVSGGKFTLNLAVADFRVFYIAN